jgi:hypothetical protein
MTDADYSTDDLRRIVGAAKLLGSANKGEAEAARLALIRLAGRAPAGGALSPSSAASLCLRRLQLLDVDERRFLLRMRANALPILADDRERLAAILERVGVSND